ncbi:uncharacterized protein LOC144953581 [Lampetra fluviatilis]
MSKHLKKKNIPTPSSEDEEDLPPAVAIPTMEGAGKVAASDTTGVQDVVAASGPSALTSTEDVGGDWSAFVWRVESAVRSVKWTDAEALEVLPTLLDDKSLKFFCSIAAVKKATLKGAFAEMAEVYEPQDDAHRRFVQRQWATEESPVAFRGAVLELAMAAYPETEPDLLEPLILGQMLELSKDLGIPLPVCGHEQLTSRMAAKCLNMQFNLRRWAEMTAWMGSPTVEGDAVVWTPSKAVFVPDERGPGDLTAAAGQWVLPGGVVSFRATADGSPRRGGSRAAGRLVVLPLRAYWTLRAGLSELPSPASSAGVPGQGRAFNAGESAVSDGPAVILPDTWILAPSGPTTATGTLGPAAPTTPPRLQLQGPRIRTSLGNGVLGRTGLHQRRIIPVPSLLNLCRDCDLWGRRLS